MAHIRLTDPSEYPVRHACRSRTDVHPGAPSLGICGSDGVDVEALSIPERPGIHETSIQKVGVTP